MPVICPTCQLNCTTRRAIWRKSAALMSGAGAGSVFGSEYRLARPGTTDDDPSPYFKTPPRPCCPEKGFPNSSVFGRKESRNLRTGLSFGAVPRFDELLPE